MTDWQTLVTLILVVGSAAFVVYASIKPWVSKPGCGTGCGKCAAPPVEEPTHRIKLPQV